MVTCAVLTISDTRTEATDTSGDALVALLTAAGHRVAARGIVRDDPAQVRAFIVAQVARDEVQAIITTGGTGISSRDNTYQAVTGLLDVTLDGFGELFRMLSYQEIGAAAMLSRATAGLVHRTLLVALPGSEAAVRLAMTRLVLPEIGHLVREAAADDSRPHRAAVDRLTASSLEDDSILHASFHVHHPTERGAGATAASSGADFPCRAGAARGRRRARARDRHRCQPRRPAI
jgi:molybdenum cofactor biosynthesis protein B